MLASDGAKCPHFPIGGVRSKKSELISPKICRVGEFPLDPPSARLAKNRKRKACPVVNAKHYTSGDDFKFLEAKINISSPTFANNSTK